MRDALAAARADAAALAAVADAERAVAGARNALEALDGPPGADR